MKYYLIAGEASGDLHASNLMKELKLLDSEASFRFFGGDLMAAQGGTLVKHYREMAFMGFIPVLLNIKTILSNMERCKKDIKLFNPDVVILVDYPGFNLKIAKFVKQQLSIPVHYYISPKVWAWKSYRVKAFKKYVDVMLSILPFEVDFFRKHDYSIHYVGNPSVDAIVDRPFNNETFTEFIQANQLENKPIIALLAGSRKREIEKNLPDMIEAVKTLEGYQVIIAGAPSLTTDDYQPFIKNREVSLIFDQTYRILAQAQAALVTSGTATLETALLNTPQVVCYKTAFPRLSYWGFKHILHTPYISLVNLIAGEEVVKELFASRFSIDNIREELNRILHVKNYRQTMLNNYAKMRQILGGKVASTRAAQTIISHIRKA